MNIFPGCFDLSCEVMMMIAMLKAHSISLYWTPRSTRLHSAKSTEMSKNVQKLCSVYSCCTEYQNVHKNVQKLSTPAALCSLFKRSVWYREMLCTFSIAITIIYSKLKSKQLGNIFTRLGNLHDFLLTSTKERKNLRFWLLSQGKKMFIFYLFSYSFLVFITRKYNHTVFSTNYNAR